MKMKPPSPYSQRFSGKDGPGDLDNVSLLALQEAIRFFIKLDGRLGVGGSWEGDQPLSMGAGIHGSGVSPAHHRESMDHSTLRGVWCGVI